MKPYIDIPDSSGMKCLHDALTIEGDRASHVVLRNITEDFWRKVIEATKLHRICAMGSPGVGKTTTTGILIRLLLEQKKTIVYRVRRLNKDGFVYMFTPASDASGEVDVKVIEEKDFMYWDKHVNNESVYYIVDPGQTKDNCNLDENFKGNVIIVASLDEGHWGGTGFHKGRGGKIGTFLYYPAWSLPELISSSSFFDVHVTEHQIVSRFGRFGGVPRIVFSTESDYYVYEEAQNRALEELTAASAISLAYTTRSAIKRQTEDLPRGILLSYVLADQDNHTFTKGYAKFSSDYVYEYIVDRYMYYLWERIVPNEGSFDPYLFETYCAKLFYDAVQPSKKSFPVKYSEEPLTAEVTDITLVQCTKKEKVENIVAAAKRREHCVFTPISKVNKLIDFMYRDGNTYYAFQSTIAGRHDASPRLIYEFVLGVINENKIGAMDLMPRIMIFYAIPMFRFDKFKTKPAKANAKAREYCKKMMGENSVLYTQWNDLVVIRFLRVDAPKEPVVSL